MKLGIVISSNDAETCWNALRYANFAIGQKDEVKVFFMGKGVGYRKVSAEKFNTMEQADKFLKSGAESMPAAHVSKAGNRKARKHTPFRP